MTFKSRFRKRPLSFITILALIPILGLIAISGWFANGRNSEQISTSATRQSSAQQAMAAVGAVPEQSGSGAASSEGLPHQYPNGVISGQSYKNDVSPPLRDIPPMPALKKSPKVENENPSMMGGKHKDQLDTVVQKLMAPLVMPTPILNFDGIPFPGVGCSCAPPDTDGEVGATQYLQMVNKGYQVFNKTTGASVLGPVAISNVWSGFGGACQTGGSGDPIVLYDQLANRWFISQFATATGGNPITDECIAVSTTSDATGTWNRYGFHLGSNFFDYPHIAVWPDAYYMSDNVFNAAGTVRLGPQPFAFDRTAMLAGTAATFVSTGVTGGASEAYYLPADLDGSMLPPVGAPNSFVEWPGVTGTYKTFHFHADFVTPASSTFTLFSSPAAAGFTELCPATRNCVPQLGSPNNLDGIGDRLMFRAADRFFPDGHESLVGNYSVSSGGVAGVRWFELRNVTSGPETVFQESTYQPDTTWRWLGSAAMDTQGNMALGFNASSASVFPQLRYAGRLVTDPLNTLAQGEATLFSGTGSQTGTGNRWGDYSDMTVDPVDDCTFWFTSEYYATTASFSWRTRIGSFKFPNCVLGSTNTPTRTVTGTPPTLTRTPTLTFTPTITPTPCGGGNYQAATGAATVVAGTTDTGNHCDDCTTNISLLFPYQLYDQTFTTVNVDSNGTLQFASTVSNFTNTCLPATGYSYAIFPYWDDLRTDGTGSGVFTSVSGSAPNRIFNIEWRATYFTGGATANFELRLYEGQNKFDIIYGTVANGNTSATSGVQKDGSFFTQFFCNGTGGAATGSVTYTFPSCATPTNTPTNTFVPPTNTRTNTPTNTFVPPTNTRTNTPTNTFVAPTNTRTNTPTNTFVPPTNTRTNTPTNTPIVNTPTRTSTSTATPCANGVYTITSANGNTIIPGITDIGNHCDDCTTSVSFPFPVTFYGASYTTAFVSSNGNLQLTGNTPYLGRTCPLPDPNLGATIMVYQDDLRTDGAGDGIFTAVQGVAPNRQFVIEWRTTYFGRAGNSNEEIVLYENSPTISTIYGANADNGASEESGVQASATGPATQFSCNTASLTAGLRVDYTYQCARSLVGHVSWQGRTVGSPVYQAPISLTLKSGITEVDYPVQNTDTSGFFTVSISGLSNGVYQWRAKGPNGTPNLPVNSPAGFLAVTGTVTLISAPVIQQEMGLMKAGDANNDNVNTVIDFNIVKSTIGRGVGDVNYDSRGDFDGNSLVNVTDFNLLKSNYAVQGGGPISPGVQPPK